MSTNSERPLLEVRDLTKRYRSVSAVCQVSFAIHQKEVLGVVGPNGAGKSTIVRLITGLMEPSSGSVLFRGEGINADLTSYKRALGYVPEQPDLYSFMTAWEYLDMVATLRRMPHSQFRQKSAALLDAFGLYSNRNVRTGAYSKGMRQRLVLIAAMLHNPAILVLDEPFSSLDVTSALVLRRVIALFAEAGKAIFFSSPVLQEAETVCTHLLVLKRGSMVCSGRIGDISRSFLGLSLEAGFMQLTEQVDADHVAHKIVAAATSPTC